LDAPTRARKIAACRLSYLNEYESVSSCYPQGAPVEVNVSFCANDNDDDDDDNSECCDQHDHSDSESELDANESEEEVESKEEEDNDAIEDDDDSEGQYETDEDSIASEHSEEDDASVMDDSSCCSTPSTSNTISHDLTNGDDHDLFLPWDVSPSVESLKYEEEDDDGSSDEEDDDDDVPSHYLHRTYMIGNNRSGRPRMWDGCPSSISVSSNSSSSSDDGSRRSQDSKSSKTMKQASKAGVSFSNSVMVYPVFQTSDYSPAMVRSIYTKRDKLWVNKLRNKREYAYDLHDRRNATEEVEMEEDKEGEMVYPVHVAEKKPISSALCRKGNVVQMYSSALGVIRLVP